MGINVFFDKDRDSLTFVISQPAIVDDTVGNLFFNPKEDEEDNDSEPITKANAMKLFKLQEDESYLVIIKNSLRFNFAIEHVSHMGVSLLNQRIRICVEGVLYNLHMVLVPFFERHLAINYVKLIKTRLDTLCPNWRSKLISISFDEENMIDRSTRRSCHLARKGVQQPCAPNLVQAEHDSNNVQESEAPPVMPADLIKIRPAAFIQDVLDPYCAHFSKHWSQEQIDDVETEHRQLHAANQFELLKALFKRQNAANDGGNP
ncbi:unnamed protein product [Sphagnum tenellum]